MLANHPENLSKESRKWLDHIRACEAAGQTMVEYARMQGLNLKGFYNTKTRLLKRGVLSLTPSAGVFRRVPVVSAGVGSSRVHLPNGVVVEFAHEFDVAWLGAVLQVASRLS
ncbi:MAG: IS66 family insertion sequence element accessory protein TnpA [Gammaproteobacteria bacterium]